MICYDTHVYFMFLTIYCITHLDMKETTQVVSISYQSAQGEQRQVIAAYLVLI